MASGFGIFSVVFLNFYVSLLGCQEALKIAQDRQQIAEDRLKVAEDGRIPTTMGQRSRQEARKCGKNYNKSAYEL